MKKAFVSLTALVALMVSVSAFAAEPAQYQKSFGTISGNTFVGAGLALRTVTVLEHPVMLATSDGIPFASQVIYEFAVDRTPVLTETANPLLQAIHNKDPWSVNELMIATNVTAQSPSLLRCVDTRGTHRLPASNYTYKATVTAATQRTRAVHRPMLS